jgi:hypothetical protein
MNQAPLTASDRTIDSMIMLAQCTKQQRILVVGSKSHELMFELERRGYSYVATGANCGRPAGKYEIALVDWRRRTVRNLEPMLDWLLNFISPVGVLVVWADPHKLEARESIRSALEGHGFVIEIRTISDDGAAFSARRWTSNPNPKAA